MKLLELTYGDTASKYQQQFLIGVAEEFKTMNPTLKDSIGVVDYKLYSQRMDDINTPEEVKPYIPMTYDLGDFCYSPKLTIDKRKDMIIMEREDMGWEVEVLKYEDYNPELPEEEL